MKSTFSHVSRRWLPLVGTVGAITFGAACSCGQSISHSVPTSTTGAQADNADVKARQDICAKIASFASLSSDDKSQLPQLSILDRKLLRKALYTALDRGDNDTKCYAAFLIGIYKPDDGALALNKFLALQDKDNMRTTKDKTGQYQYWWWGKFPAVEGLIAIGQPSVECMISNLTDDSTTLTRRLSLYVIWGVLRDKETINFYLSRAQKQAKDQVSRDRLEEAIKIVDTNKERDLTGLVGVTE